MSSVAVQHSGPEVAARRRVWALAAAFGAAVVLGACVSASNAGACKVGADCASGVCHDGACVVDGSTGGGGSGAAAGSGGEAGGSTTSNTTSTTTTGSGGGALCSPNGDGLIERDEVPIEAGLSAKFLATVDTTFGTAGTVVGGVRNWDLTVPLAGDHASILETQPLAGKWFAPEFVGATYAARLSESEDLLGVFEVTDTALLLRGVVSPLDGLTKTELTYAPPVIVLAFPVSLNASWTTTSTVSGLANGIFTAYTEHYDDVVDAEGSLETPFAAFDALRVRVVLDRTVGVLTTRIRTFAFVTECFGTVATLVSQPNEFGTEFTSVAEVRRLSN